MNSYSYFFGFLSENNSCIVLGSMSNPLTLQPSDTYKKLCTKYIQILLQDADIFVKSYSIIPLKERLRMAVILGLLLSISDVISLSLNWAYVV